MSWSAEYPFVAVYRTTLPMEIQVKYQSRQGKQINPLEHTKRFSNRSSFWAKRRDHYSGTCEYLAFTQLRAYGREDLGEKIEAKVKSISALKAKLDEA